MIRLLYVSTAIPNLPKDELDQIVASANQKNAENKITGALGFNGVNFAQILEGEEDELDALMSKIKNDTRHSGVIEIMRKEIDQRRYEGWNMKLVAGRQFNELVEAIGHEF